MVQKRDPQEVGLKKGDLVAFVETGQGVLLSPQEVIASEALDQSSGRKN
jgi:hypothetical protein